MLNLLLLPLLAFAPQDTDPVRAAYVAAHAAGDAAALGELWREHPGRILTTIDADLEGSLAAWEKDPLDTETIEALEARAVWGARIASEVTGRGIFHDYACSFAGWEPEEKESFRAGQAAFGAARKALADDPEKALEQARRCLELAAPLGDWWGTAMGYSMEARALLSLGRWEEAAAAAGQSRLLYAGLGLGRNELGELSALSMCARQLERWSRMEAISRAGARLAGELGATDQREEWLKLLAEAHEAQGEEAAAQAVREELGKG